VAEIDRWEEAKSGAEAEQALKLMPWFESIDSMDVAVACVINFVQRPKLLDRLSAGGCCFGNSTG